ncbi:hypothetical protein [Flavicella marina]|uniref:hypothetical protein n=1 Tax=Flavicella marina TaxID=1475951 RepID=UPI0012659D3F|nr:hypothetical protein [Flavicella marina]
MTKYSWKINSQNGLSKFLILDKYSIWISTINEKEISIEKAIEDKKLFGKTKFYKFYELENIIFDEDNQNIILNYLSDEDGKSKPSVEIKLNTSVYLDFKNIILKLKNTPLKNMTFFDREKSVIFALGVTVIIGIVLLYTIGLSRQTIGILIGTTVTEIAILKGFNNAPKNGKILKLN